MSCETFNVSGCKIFYEGHILRLTLTNQITVLIMLQPWGWSDTGSYLYSAFKGWLSFRNRPQAAGSLRYHYVNCFPPGL